MKFQLPNTISSPQDLRGIILEIKGYARWYAHASVKKKVTNSTTNSGAPALSPTARAIVRYYTHDKPFDRKDLDTVIAALEDLAKTLPQISITLAAPIPASLKKTLTAWCRENIGPNVLVNFRFNATLLGGMVVRSGSHIYDWSFRRQILAGRERFPGVLRRV